MKKILEDEYLINLLYGTFTHLPPTIKLIIELLIMRLEKVSPPLKGGVAGRIDYLTFTRFIPRLGWLIYSFFYLYIYEKQ